MIQAAGSTFSFYQITHDAYLIAESELQEKYPVNTEHSRTVEKQRSAFSLFYVLPGSSYLSRLYLISSFPLLSNFADSIETLELRQSTPGERLLPDKSKKRRRETVEERRSNENVSIRNRVHFHNKSIPGNDFSRVERKWSPERSERSEVTAETAICDSNSSFRYSDLVPDLGNTRKRDFVESRSRGPESEIRFTKQRLSSTQDNIHAFPFELIVLFRERKQRRGFHNDRFVTLGRRIFTKNTIVLLA
ncbi:uncharacterized protein LOC143188676 [Calliopsis andreniformis]|uniref:uncharacterized protein LOC143188676 n=1 Tax=Calliopsis andreniformis TaxID=337506 RepID=UPI003FCC2F99